MSGRSTPGIGMGLGMGARTRGESLGTGIQRVNWATGRVTRRTLGVPGAASYEKIIDLFQRLYGRVLKTVFKAIFVALFTVKTPLKSLISTFTFS